MDRNDRWTKPLCGISGGSIARLPSLRYVRLQSRSPEFAGLPGGSLGGSMQGLLMVAQSIRPDRTAKPRLRRFRHSSGTMENASDSDGRAYARPANRPTHPVRTHPDSYRISPRPVSNRESRLNAQNRYIVCPPPARLPCLAVSPAPVPCHPTHPVTRRPDPVQRFSPTDF